VPGDRGPWFLHAVRERCPLGELTGASTFLPAAVDPATVSTPYALLDKFNDDASTQVADIMKEAGMFVRARTWL